jgi:hypothetical protein
MMLSLKVVAVGFTVACLMVLGIWAALLIQAQRKAAEEVGGGSSAHNATSDKVGGGDGGHCCHNKLEHDHAKSSLPDDYLENTDPNAPAKKLESRAGKVAGEHEKMLPKSPTSAVNEHVELESQNVKLMAKSGAQIKQEAEREAGNLSGQPGEQVSSCCCADSLAGDMHKVAENEEQIMEPSAAAHIEQPQKEADDAASALPANGKPNCCGAKKAGPSNGSKKDVVKKPGCCQKPK